MPKSSRKPERQRSQTPSQRPRAVSSQTSTPSTPISKNMSSPQITKKQSSKEANERVLETPPKKRPATSSQGKQTPERTNQLAQANSPHTPFGISSGEESDSDCVIEKVLPSPKRKLVAPSPRARPSKKPKTDQRSAAQRGYACIKASVLAKDSTASGQKKIPAKPAAQRQAASVPPRAPSPNLTSSSVDLSRSNSVPPTNIPIKASQVEHKTQHENRSDSCIEKAQLSPKKRHQPDQQKANAKRRRIGDSIETPVSIDADEAEDQIDSDCEVVKVGISPMRRRAAKIRPSTNRDQDKESSTEKQKIATPRKPKSPAVVKTPTPATSVAACDNTPSRAVHIDLTQESSDSSDFSDEETAISKSQPALPTPVENALNSQDPRAAATEHAVSSDTDKRISAPEETISDQEQKQSSPEDVMSSLWDWTKCPQTNKAPSISSSNRSSLDHELLLSTAPEQPYDDSAAKKIKVEAHDDDMASIKKESIGLYNSDDYEDSDDESRDGGMCSIKQESSPMHAPFSDDEGGSDEDGIRSIKLEEFSSPRSIFTVKQYEFDSNEDSEEEYQGLSDLSDDEVSQAAMPNDSEENGGLRSSPPLSYQPPQDDVSPKAVFATVDETTRNPVAKHLNNVSGSMKTHLVKPGMKYEKRPSPSVYELQPVYSGEKLVESHTPGTPAHQKVLTKTPTTSGDLVSKNWTWTSPLPKGAQWLQQKEEFTPLESIQDENTASNAASSQGTPTKISVKRPVSQKRAKTQRNTTDVEESEDELEKRLQEQQLEPGPDKHWTKPLEKELKPPVIRDGVSEHAIKPTVALFKKKIAAGQGFRHDKSSNSNKKYNWETDWSMPASLNERESHAVAMELEHRGIKTGKQYSNFWYNLTMKFSQLAGSPIPLFTAKKKALDTFVEEAMQNQAIRRRNKRKITKAQKKSRRLENKKQQPKDVDAFLIPGDTDESEAEGSDSDVSGADLIAKMQADIEKRKKVSGGGTSCGLRRKNVECDV
ncbi:t-complex 1 subunit beta [Fusarium beomiforme]|uniref:T-complex 1 subunit beta n=1 Tax=Fusarium beomiforme TaxID=44412 RepID=A0A9P5E1X8_9HYPO|nr:t-complex 1 subunit beta [Fusarium beomiforme]